MANIKNFGLIGVGSDVQFGKSGPRLTQTTGAFQFRNAGNTGFADITAKNITADALSGSAGQLLAVDAAGTLVLGGLADSFATDAEVAAIQATLQGLITAEETARIAADSTLTTNLAAEVTRATGEEARIEGLVTAETTRATTAEGALQTAITAEETARIAGDATNATAIAAEETRALAAEAALSTRITDDVAALTAADAALAALITDEHDHHTAETAALNGRIDTEIADRAAAVSALDAKFESALAGLAWENPVDLFSADHTVETVTEGARVLNTTDNKIYTKTAGGWDLGEALVQGAAFFYKADDAGYMFNGTSVVQFNGAAGITAGNGLVKTGNTLNIVSDSGTITVTADSIDVSTTVLNSITANADALATETAARISGDDGLGIRIDDEIAARLAGDAAEAAARASAVTALTSAFQAADTALQTAIDAEVARATAAEGVIAGDLAAEITRATGVEGGLDSRLTTAEGKIVTLETASADHETRITDLEALATISTASLQAEIDAIEAGVGLATDGSWTNPLGLTESNDINNATTLTGLVSALYTYTATELQTAATARTALNTALNNEVARATAAETALGVRIDDLTTSDVAEGTNLYFTDARARAAVSVVANDYLTYNSTTGEFSLALAGVATEAYADQAEADAKAYTDARETVIRTDFAAADASTLSSANAYADSLVAAGVANAARAVYATFSGANAVIGTVKGFVHRVKVYVNVAAGTDSAVQVGTASVNNQLADTANVDSSVTGIYVIEVGQLYGTDTELSVFVGDAGCAGSVVVEYV